MKFLEIFENFCFRLNTWDFFSELLNVWGFFWDSFRVSRHLKKKTFCQCITLFILNLWMFGDSFGILYGFFWDSFAVFTDFWKLFFRWITLGFFSELLDVWGFFCDSHIGLIWSFKRLFFYFFDLLLLLVDIERRQYPRVSFIFYLFYIY